MLRLFVWCCSYGILMHYRERYLPVVMCVPVTAQ